MTIKAIRLKNFLAFKDTQWIELRPISLLFGRNSSGKSSIIRALRLLRQSLDHCSDDNALLFVHEDGVDLGSFRSCVHLHEISSSITFGFRVKISSPSTNALDLLIKTINSHRVRNGLSRLKLFRDDLNKDSKKDEIEIEVELSYGWNPKDKKVILTGFSMNCKWDALQDQDDNLVFSIYRDFNPLFLIDNISGESNYEWEWGEWLPFSSLLHGHEESATSNPWAKISLDLLAGFFPRPSDLSGINKLDTAIAADIELTQNLIGELHKEVENFLRSIVYFGPLRPKPERVFSYRQNDIVILKKRGWNGWIDFLSNSISDTYKAAQIDAWFAELGLGSKIQVIDYFKGQYGITSEVTIDEVPQLVRTNLLDSGFGASQILPILVESILAKPGALLIIEQPELHLHPRAQAQLSDIFLLMAKQKIHPGETEDPAEQERKTYFLLETHSENILLRIRRRIAEATLAFHQGRENDFLLDENDLQIVFVHRADVNSSCIELKISEWGEYLDELPEFSEFFNDDLDEMLRIYEARALYNSGSQ